MRRIGVSLLTAGMVSLLGSGVAFADGRGPDAFTFEFDCGGEIVVAVNPEDNSAPVQLVDGTEVYTLEKLTNPDGVVYFESRSFSRRAPDVLRTCTHQEWTFVFFTTGNGAR